MRGCRLSGIVPDLDGMATCMSVEKCSVYGVLEKQKSICTRLTAVTSKRGVGRIGTTEVFPWGAPEIEYRICSPCYRG